MKDKSYQGTPVGVMVARYIRWLRNEYGATPSTIRDYEAILARMSLSLADKELIEVSVEDLRDIIDLWGGRAARTRQKVISVIRAFWSWAEEQGHIAISPAARIRRPKAEQKVAALLPLDARPRLLSQAKHPRDRLGLFCLLALGLRRAELACIRIRDFDAERGVLRVRGKGQKERLLPLRAVRSSSSCGPCSRPSSRTSSAVRRGTTTCSTRSGRSQPAGVWRGSSS
jgi:site-specific recombinase XerD